MSEQEWICKRCLETRNELVPLKMFHINFKEGLYMCMNKGCVFPFNEGRIIYDYIVECKLDMSDSEESGGDDKESSHIANHSTENSHDRPITDSSCITSNGVCNSKFGENNILKAFDDMSASCNLNGLQEHDTASFLNTDEDFERAVERELDELRKYVHCHAESAGGNVFSDVPSPESGITEEYDQNNTLTNGMNSGKQKETTCMAADLIPNLVAGKQTYTESSLSEGSTSKWKGAGIQNSTGKNNTPELERTVGQKFTKEENDQVFIRKESALPEEKPGKLKETSVQKCAEQESCSEQKDVWDNESPPSDKNSTSGGHNSSLPRRSTRAKKNFCRDYHYY